ncbi:MAG: hypothetical protein WCK29_00630 [archaeon]
MNSAETLTQRIQAITQFSISNKLTQNAAKGFIAIARMEKEIFDLIHSNNLALKKEALKRAAQYKENAFRYLVFDKKAIDEERVMDSYQKILSEVTTLYETAELRVR